MGAAALGDRDGSRPSLDDVVVRLHDLAGRPRGSGFVADHHGTVITSHEAVDGLRRLVLSATGGRSCVVTADEVIPLPALDLALVRTRGLGVDPLPVTVRDRIDTGTYVHIAAGGWREARVLGATDVTYTATDRFHHLGDALELAIGTAGRDALRLGGGAAGGPVLDALTGAVVGVLGTALRCGPRDTGFAVPLPRTAGPLAELLARNAATVPAYSADLNLAGVLELTATSLAQDGPPGPPEADAGDGPPGPAESVTPVERPDVTAEFTAFLRGPAAVLGLVGAPGSGRTTELAALAARRHRSAEPAPTLWLSGADLAGDDGSVADAAGRALTRAARIVAASRSALPADLGDLTPHRLARLARTVGRPLLLLLDGPEEMPAALAHRLPEWTAGSAQWLRETGTRLVVACRPEFWEEAAPGFPTDTVHDGCTGSLTPPALDGVDAGRAGASTVPAPDGVRSGRNGDLAAPAPDAVCGGRAGGFPLPRSDATQASGTGDLTGPALDGVCAGRNAGLAAPAPDAEYGGRAAVFTPPALDGVDAGRAGASTVPAPDAVCGGRAGGFPLPRSDATQASGTGDLTGPALDGVCAGRNAGLAAPAPDAEYGGRAAVFTPPASDGVDAGRAGASTVPALDRVRAGHAGDLAVPAPARTAAPAPPAAVLAPARVAVPVPPAVHLGDLPEPEARRARARYGIPETALSGADARHPLTLRLLSEIRAALPAEPGEPTAPVDRDDVFSAHLDLICLRVAERLAAAGGLRGTAVRRLAAKVAGQVHEAARRSLGPGPGELDPVTFEMLFPWGPAPARLGGGTGWASAVLTEGLLVPAGGGYRFGHEELADWLQGMHLDLDGALRALVHRRTPPHGERPDPVPHHRVGSVVQALLLLARQQGTAQLALRMEELVYALDTDPDSWWALRLLAGTLSRVPDATPYTDILRLLAERLADRDRRDRPPPAEFGPAFWTALSLPDDIRLDLLRRLVLADGPPTPPGRLSGTAPPRFLDAVAALLAADPVVVQPHLVRWFEDERPLPATPHATVAKAAQALLHTHRHRAPDALTEVLADSAHPRADELLAALAEDEPSAVCRAVGRWAHDARPRRRAAAVTHALRAAPRVRADADRELLRHAALTLLAGPVDHALHGGALALLVRDPHTRARHLPRALGHFADGDPLFPPSALAAALPTHQDPVLDAFRARLRHPDARAALRTLVDVTTPALAGRVAVLVREAVAERPATAVHLAACLDRRLDRGPAARPVLLPLVTGLLDGGPQPVRAALAAVLAAPGTPASRPLRRELLDVLLAHESDPAVLDALLRTAVESTAARDPAGLRDLALRTGRLLVRTPDGATRLDCALVDLARQVPGFAALLAGWLSDAPREWAAVVGPGARRMIENLAGVRVPA
ncbi:trypsin-like peptidase domain-containing protein [Streptomyces sp. NPDC005574]|uniref:trypsin-like peptidase domain-containing protein n=1 Tax=Streptomyces sp. NPDC005574 TaxID=3156891 RepID=UPI0033B8ACF9